MKVGEFEFNLRELAGSMGDFGTLFPLAVGYIVVCGLNPAGFLVMMGITNIITGIMYRLPMPVEPMKVLAVVAIAQHWSPAMIYASAFGMGIVWIFFAVSGIIDRIAHITPQPVIRGIQASLGILLAVEAYKMISTWWMIGIVSIIVVVLLRQNRYAPAALVLMILGIIIMLISGQFRDIPLPAFTLPHITGFMPEQVWQTMLLAGFAQIPLTVTNATIATSSLIDVYWPGRNVSVRKLSLNQGLMNIISPFFGGMPMCHGAGGLAGQYYFGARTGGANIMEGLMEIFTGLFLAGSIAGLLMLFPMAIIGAMMFMAGLELTKFTRDIRFGIELIPMAVTIIISVALNMALGYITGLAVAYTIRFLTIHRT
jgi:predicted benzoate:H+ symporter BenE